MSFQIKTIVLFGRNGDKRLLNFRLGAVNIITGKSRTGKSSIINILDYCLGRSTFNVFEGVNRDTVTWYGVVIQATDRQVLIAKPAPQGTAHSQSQVYFRSAKEIELPSVEELRPNTNDEGVKEYLSKLLGIASNQTVLEESRSMGSFEATIDHTKYYLFQSQGVVANQDLLFWRQSESLIAQHIKDTLPYFLGAVQEERLYLTQELRLARRELKLAQKKLQEAEAIVSSRAERARSLLVEAQEAGLVDTDSNYTDDQLIDELRRVATWVPAEEILVGGGQIPKLQEHLQALRRTFQRKRQEVKDAEFFLRQAEGFTGEAQEQVMRLEAIGLFNGKDVGENYCPVCASQLETPTPSVTAITGTLERIQGSLENVRQIRPKVEDHIDSLRTELEELREDIRGTSVSLNTLLDEQEAKRHVRDRHVHAAFAVGRVRLYLESVQLVDPSSVLQQNVKKAERRVQDLERQLDPDAVKEATISILNVIGSQMTHWAERLELEFAGSPYRFDASKLTVIADTSERAIPMERMGSAENWLGCHLITLLALHQHFHRRHRPVPRFLVLDQPSQVYFPSREAYLALEGEKSDLEELSADVVAVKRMFSLLFDVCDQLAPHFQIIVMEHANLDDDRFQQALVEEPWTGDRALIPQSWLS